MGISFIQNWLYSVWNQVDYARIKKLGADRVAAEWLLKNGARLRWKDTTTAVSQYNNLPPESMSRNLHISHIIADNASINEHGLPHLRDLMHLESVQLHNCERVNNQFLYAFYELTKTHLRRLSIVNCYAVNDNGIKRASCMKNLEILEFYDLPLVEDVSELEKFLKTELSQCQIITK